MRDLALPVAVIVTGLICVSTASPVAAQRYQPGTPEARVALLAAAIGFVRLSCSDLEVDLNVSGQAAKATGIKMEKVLEVGRSDTAVELIAAYSRDPKNACAALLLDFGPSGHIVPGMIFRR
ncbi:hypothetical protein [Methylobacterium oxalidis]|uniref:hypothetical protein n=1 Tax=Methylobacterium oxalidis TaxID=944322 RepID=UPI00331516B2